MTQFFEPNPMKAISNFHEIIFMLQVNKMNQDKVQFIMYVVELLKMQYVHAYCL